MHLLLVLAHKLGVLKSSSPNSSSGRGDHDLSELDELVWVARDCVIVIIMGGIIHIAIVIITS